MSPELAAVDRLLDDPRFFEPYRRWFDPLFGRPSIPMETYLRLMFLKYRYRLGYETLCAEVSDSLTWLRFCRIPIGERAPHPTTLMKITTPAAGPRPSRPSTPSSSAPPPRPAWSRTHGSSSGALIRTASLDALVGYTGQSRGRAPTHTWNTRPLAVADHGGLVADGRNAAPHLHHKRWRTAVKQGQQRPGKKGL
jgi:hypothetical protein